MGSILKIEQRGLVTLFTFDNPAKRNCISQATAKHLQAALKEFDASSQRVAVFTGGGEEAFTAGADLRDVPEFWRIAPGVGFRTDKPLIAAVSGHCIGAGMTLTAMCDLAVAAENSVFAYPEARLGLSQGFMSGLVNRIPQKVAMVVLLLGRKLDARRAYEVGLINEVTPNGRHLARALELADEVAAAAPKVVRLLKHFANRALPGGPSEEYARVFQRLEEVRLSEDCQEGFAASREKRAPVFHYQ